MNKAIRILMEDAEHQVMRVNLIGTSGKVIHSNSVKPRNLQCSLKNGSYSQHYYLGNILTIDTLVLVCSPNLNNVDPGYYLVG